MSKSVSCEPCGLKFASELVSGVIKWMDFHLSYETYTVSYQMARWPRPLGGGGRGLGMRLGVYRQAGEYCHNASFSISNYRNTINGSYDQLEGTVG